MYCVSKVPPITGERPPPRTCTAWMTKTNLNHKNFSLLITNQCASSGIKELHSAAVLPELGPVLQNLTHPDKDAWFAPFEDFVGYALDKAHVD